MTDKTEDAPIMQALRQHLAPAAFDVQPTCDAIPTVWVDPASVKRALAYLKSKVEKPYAMLYDLTAIDERDRKHREGQPDSDFTVVYQLLSPERSAFVRIKTAVSASGSAVPTVTDLWPGANWYEREAWDMFGIEFPGHPHLRRILCPPWWEGHPLRKEHPARATEMGRFHMSVEEADAMQKQLQFVPEEWGMARTGNEDIDYLFLNMGPQHPGTHGALRVILQLAGQEVVDAVCDIGYHHRGAEKMAERQTWHSFIPYTDRIDYLGGSLNNLAYVLAVEKLAGIEVPERARTIRVMLCEIFRVISHLVFYGTFVQDVGAMSPVFYMFNDRERALDIIEAVTGGRMHPSWFRIGGTAMDLPEGWDRMVRDFLDYMPSRLDEYDSMVLRNSFVKARTVGIGEMTTEQAVEWGATGPMLRSTGLAWDMRKQRPYSGYDQFEFDVPAGTRGDCYDRLLVHAEEMRQSLRIIEQCLDNMPPGPYKADHPLTTPPRKERTLQDIETLITHFLSVSWGPVIPPGEATVPTEGSKGCNSYYLISDGNSMSYRTRIRTPSFPHIQLVPELSRGLMLPDLVAILGSVDFVLADVDR